MKADHGRLIRRGIALALLVLIVTSIDDHFVRTHGTLAGAARTVAGAVHVVAFIAAPAAMAGLCRRRGIERATRCWASTTTFFGWIVVFMLGLIAVAMTGGLGSGRVFEVPAPAVLPLALLVLLGVAYAWIGSCVVTRREVDDRATEAAAEPVGA